MISVLIQLTSAGADTGPFEITSDGESPAFSVVLATVSKAALTAGITVDVQDDTTVIRVTSTGVCTNYQDVPIDVPASTTTTTSTAPVTPATVTVVNNSVDLSISNVIVDGITISGATFPVDATESTSGTTSSLGTQTITIIVLGTAPSQSIKVIDSAGTLSCHEFIGNGSYQFFNQVVNNSVPVQVIAHNAVCAATTTTTTSTSTTTTTTTALPYNALQMVTVGVPDTTLDYDLQLSNISGSPITFRLRLLNTKDNIWHQGPQHIVPDGTINQVYAGTITAFGVSNVNGDIIDAELSNNDGSTWTAVFTFDPPYTLPYPA